MEKLYECIKCGTKEEPKKFERKKNFLCSICKDRKEEIEKILDDNGIIDSKEIINYLVNKGYTLSITGIPYKYYGKMRVSLSNSCSTPMLIVVDNGDNICFTDSSIISSLPKEAVLDLKKVINTVEYLWNNQK